MTTGASSAATTQDTGGETNTDREAVDSTNTPTTATVVGTPSKDIMQDPSPKQLTRGNTQVTSPHIEKEPAVDLANNVKEKELQALKDSVKQAKLNKNVSKSLTLEDPGYPSKPSGHHQYSI
jgi:hypothetical protein